MKRGPRVRVLLAVALAALSVMPGRASAQDTEPRPTNVRLTFHLIAANGSQTADPEIQAVVTELRRLFRFEGYRLLTKSILHATSYPNSDVEQTVTDVEGRDFRISARVSPLGGSNVRLAVQLFAPDQKLIDAAVNLQDGKTVVLGTANVGRMAGQSGAIILAVTPTINP